MGSVDAKTLDSVLVIGGCGYLGSNLVRFLLEEPTCSSVHVMSRNPVNNIHQRAIYHVGDVSSSDQVATLLEKIKPKVIFHTASPKYTDTEKTLRRTNIDGTNVLLKSALASPAVKALVYTSTDSAIVQKPGHLLTEETAELYTEKSNVSAYAKTKAIADAMVLGANSLNLHTAVIRIPGLYGPNDDNCMGSLLKSLKKGQQKVQVGNNDKHFEFVYVDSACAAHILAAKALTSPDQESAVFKVDGEAFFISDGASLPYFDFARKVYAFAGHPVLKEDIQIIPYLVVLIFAMLSEWFYWIFTLGTKTPDVRKLGIQYLNGGCEWDITKAKEKLGYEPVKDMDAILKATVEHECNRLKIH